MQEAGGGVFVDMGKALVGLVLRQSNIWGCARCEPLALASGFSVICPRLAPTAHPKILL